MSGLTYSQARRLAQDVEDDLDRFEAFLIGYVVGAKDMEQDIEYPDDEAFRDRMRAVYRDEYPDTYL